MTKKRAPKASQAELPELPAFDHDAHERRLVGIRDVTKAELFRVFAQATDPHHIGEYVVHVDPEGITIRESYDELPGAGDESQVSWHDLHWFSRAASDHMREIERDTKAVWDELEAVEHIRNKEAHRILRAKEIQRTAYLRELCDRARQVLGVWERPRVARKSASTWREIVGRRNGRPGRE
jgi:hypothetical protein